MFWLSRANRQPLFRTLSPSKVANKSTLPKKYLYTSLKPVLKCKQVENNNLRNIFKRSNFSKKKKKTFLRILKIRGGILLHRKNFFQFSKNNGGWWRTTKQLFFFGLILLLFVVPLEKLSPIRLQNFQVFLAIPEFVFHAELVQNTD